MNSLNIRKQLVLLVVGLTLLLSVSITAGKMGIAEVDTHITVAGGIDQGGGA